MQSSFLSLAMGSHQSLQTMLSASPAKGINKAGTKRCCLPTPELEQCWHFLDMLTICSTHLLLIISHLRTQLHSQGKSWFLSNGIIQQAWTGDTIETAEWQCTRYFPWIAIGWHFPSAVWSSSKIELPANFFQRQQLHQTALSTTASSSKSSTSATACNAELSIMPEL